MSAMENNDIQEVVIVDDEEVILDGMVIELGNHQLQEVPEQPSDEDREVQEILQPDTTIRRCFVPVEVNSINFTVLQMMVFLAGGKLWEAMGIFFMLNEPAPTALR